MERLARTCRHTCDTRTLNRILTEKHTATATVILLIRMMNKPALAQVDTSFALSTLTQINYQFRHSWQTSILTIPELFWSGIFFPLCSRLNMAIKIFNGTISLLIYLLLLLYIYAIHVKRLKIDRTISGIPDLRPTPPSRFWTTFIQHAYGFGITFVLSL